MRETIKQLRKRLPPLLTIKQYRDVTNRSYASTTMWNEFFPMTDGIGARDLGAQRLQMPPAELRDGAEIRRNRPGASGNLAIEAVVRPSRTVTTLLLAASANAIAAAYHGKLKFNFLEDIAPFAAIMR